MDQIQFTKAQLVALAKLNQDVTITGVNEDAGLIHYERTKYRGDRGEGKWMKADGKLRESVTK